jgi:hypothetical protein
MKHHLAGVLILCMLLLLLAACSVKNEPNANVFAHVISQQLEQSTRCLFVGSFPRRILDSGPPTGFDALASAGVLERNIVNVPGPAISGKSYPVRFREYQLTAKGSESYRADSQQLCYAPLEVVAVTRFSSPAAAMGKIISQVTYTYRARSVASWALDVNVQKTYQPVRSTIAVYVRPRETTAVLSQGSDGWHVETLGLEPQISSR